MDRKLYLVNPENGKYEEIAIEFPEESIEKNEPGFMENSEWLQYICLENAFNTLPDFLDGSITGYAFDRDRQIRAYGDIAANHNGTWGEKEYQSMKDRLLQR